MNSKITLLVITAVFMALSVFAENSTLVITTPDSKGSVYNVLYKSVESGRVKISIYDEKNNKVYAETLTNVRSFRRPFNFDQMSSGVYTVVIEDKNGKQTEVINHVPHSVSTTMRVSRIAGAEQKFMLKVVNNGSEEVSIRIYDNLRGLLYEDRLQVTGSNGLIYNLSQAKIQSGAIIIFEVSTDNGYFESAMF
jgi:hypothetical protein